ncbi:MAG TPA: SDR family NAD(P)-dependent oxidoreductase [Gemmataceae bacterium]|nr:SDR family NAD(P)-dependent oxidoreductase [Gemmataceae bacterium]
MSTATSVALVTGAGSGLGRALALALAAEGHAIAAVDVRPEGLVELERELPGRIAWATADVADAAALTQATADLERRLGPIDLLIANAGIGFETSALTFRAEDFAAHIRVNLLGVANSVAAVLPGMLQRRRGHLAAISSLASFRGLPLMAGYCASKAGVNALMDALRVELKPQGIFVTTICPGWIRTPLSANLKFPVPRMLEVGEAARRIVRALRERRPFFAFPRGPAWQVRLLRWLPSRLSDWLVARLLRRAAPESPG